MEQTEDVRAWLMQPPAKVLRKALEEQKEYAMVMLMDACVNTTDPKVAAMHAVLMASQGMLKTVTIQKEAIDG